MGCSDRGLVSWLSDTGVELIVTVSSPSVDAFDDGLVMLTLTLPEDHAGVFGGGAAHAADSFGIRLSRDSTDWDLLEAGWL